MSPTWQSAPVDTARPFATLRGTTVQDGSLADDSSPSLSLVRKDVLVTHHTEPSTRAAAPSSGEVGVPHTDDPVVLRELLRQAREQLRLRESIEQLMADNLARTEALLTQARASSNAADTIDRQSLTDAVEELRTCLHDAMSVVDRLAALLQARPDVPDDRMSTSIAASIESASEEPRRVDVLIHNIHAPALARSVQQHLLDIDGIVDAEVRELAEGLLRITVTATGPVTAESLASWEPNRRRTVRTSSASVLELELDPDMS